MRPRSLTWVSNNAGAEASLQVKGAELVTLANSETDPTETMAAEVDAVLPRLKDEFVKELAKPTRKKRKALVLSAQNIRRSTERPHLRATIDAACNISFFARSK